MDGLAGIRVVDLSTGIPGPYATKLFADAGAEVIKVESATGDPMRRWSASGSVPEGEDGALFRFLNTSKRSVTADIPDDELAGLTAGADLVVEEGTVDVDALRDRDPGLVVLSVTGWGRTGPWAGRPWTDFTVQAASGSVIYRGRPDGLPYQAGGRIAEWTTGCYAASSALAAVLHARRTGTGAHVDVSVVESMAIAGSTFIDTMYSMLGRPPLEGTVPRNTETPSIEPAADGWVGFNTNSGQMFQSFLLLIERPDLMDDPEWGSLAHRAGHLDEWEAIMHAFTTRHPAKEIVDRAAELRVPATTVYSGRTVLDNEHLVDRGAFVPNPAGFLQPRPPYRVDGEHVRPLEPAPALGESNGRIELRPREEPEGDGGGDDAPFAGTRIVDLTSWWAGPASTHLAASLGAEVIHVESTGHPDGMRTTGFIFGQPNWWEWSHMFAPTNTNKLGITLDLRHPEGLELGKELIRRSDGVVENFSPRVTEQWGITWELVQELNERAVFMRMPAFGLSGPWRERVGFAQTMEQMSGMAWVTGPEGGPPRIMRGPCDPIAGHTSAFALLMGLHEARRSGRGVFIEAPMIEAALNCSAEQIVEATAYGVELTRHGNRSAYAAPQGLYRCRGHEQYVALSVVTDAHWQALVEVLGSPEWASDPALATVGGRHAAHDELDGQLQAWAEDQDVAEVVDALVAGGVPAVVAWDPRAAYQHPQLAARPLYEEVVHPVTGPNLLPAMPFRWSGIDRWLQRPAPTLGQHNREVLGGVLGVDDADLDRLEKEGVIGTSVAGAFRAAG